MAVFRTWTPVSIRSSTLALVVESADFLGVLLLVRAAILSEATRIARFARSRRSDLISSPRLGASSSPATTPKPSPAKKSSSQPPAAASGSLRQFAVRCQLVNQHYLLFGQYPKMMIAAFVMASRVLQIPVGSRSLHFSFNGSLLVFEYRSFSVLVLNHPVHFTSNEDGETSDV